MANTGTVKIALKVIDDKDPIRTIRNLGGELEKVGQRGQKALNDMNKSAKTSMIKTGQESKKILNDTKENSEALTHTIKKAGLEVIKYIEDSLVDFVKTGKFRIKELANSIAQNLGPVAVQEIFTKPITNWFTKLFSSKNQPDESQVQDTESESQKVLKREEEAKAIDSSQENQNKTGESPKDLTKENEVVSSFEAIKKAGLQTINHIDNSLMNFVKTGKFRFKELANSIIQDLARIAIQQLFTKPVTNWFTGLFSAKGNVFDTSGHIKAYAHGGFFTNKIVSRPTMFAHGGGFGVMGEAGPEAILPLKRMPGGDLGVRTDAHSANIPNIQVNVINNTGTLASVRQEEPRWDGGKWVLGVVLGAMEKNTGGFRTNLQAMARS